MSSNKFQTILANKPEKNLEVPGLNQSKIKVSRLSSEDSNLSVTIFVPTTEVKQDFSYCAGLENYPFSSMRVKEIIRQDIDGKTDRYLIAASSENINAEFQIIFPVETETGKIRRCFSN